MAVTPLTRTPDGRLVPSEGNVGLHAREDDIVLRWQAEAAEREQPSDTYKNVIVEVDVGAEQRDLKLRYAAGSRFIFACFSDNPEWHRVPREIWQAMAGEALDKYCAMQGLSALDSAKQEVDNRFNFFVETRQVLK